MAKKLKKNTTIAKAKSLKTNVTRKFKGGGPSNFNVQDLIDPEKPVGGPAKDQFFPKYYEANKPAFDAADTQARGMGTDWYSKRRELPQFTNTSDVFLKTFNEAAPSYYFPEEPYDNTSYFGGDTDAAAFTNQVKTTPGEVQNPAARIMHENPYATPKYKANWTKTVNEEGKDDNLNANSVYYRGMAGAKPYIAYEELNHIASGIANHIPETNHAEGMKVLKNTVTPKSIRKMGYTDVGRGLPKYYADEEEYLTSLNTARTSFGLDATKNYTEEEALKILEEGSAKGNQGGYNPENAEAEQMARFYRAIGYPTKTSKILNQRDPSTLTGKDLEKYNQAKKDAAKRFLITHNAVAENEGGNTEDYGLPQAVRYGGYQKYVNGGPGKKKDPLKKATIATAADSSFVADGADIANNYYLNNGYTIKPNADFKGGVFNPFDMLAAKRKYYNNGTNIDINTGETIPYSDYTTYKKGNPQFEQRELTIGILNKDAPRSKYDTRIKPQKMVTYGKRFDKTNSGYANDVAEVPVYDRVATTPWKDLTDDEKIQRLQEFGESGTPYKAADIQQAIQDIEKNRKPVESIGIKPIESESAPVKSESQFPQESYTLEETGNGGGAAYLHKTVRDKYGNIIQSANMGVVLTEDFLTPEQQKEFDSIAGGTAVVQFNPKARVWHDLREPLDIIEEKRGTRQKTLEMQKRNVDEVNAEKAAYEQYEQQLRDKEKARQKKIQEEIEAEKAANKKAMGGFGDPEDPEKPWRHKIKSKDGNYLYNRVGTNAIQDYDKSTVRRTLKGFITGAPKPEKTIYRTSDAKFAEGGMNKNMLNANSTTGPRSEHSWQDPGVNRFSGNTNGVNADYYFKKGGLKSKVSSKFAKLKL